MAVILFRRTGEVVPALPLNLFKNSVALPLFVVTMLALGVPFFLAGSDSHDLTMLLVSGVIGIGVADTFFLMTINRVGAGLQAIINTSYSPTIILLSLLFLNETLTLWQLIGASFIVAAVISVTWIRDPGPGIPRARMISGVVFGVLASLTQGISIVMIKPLLNETPLLWANFWRLLGGTVASLLLTLLWPNKRAGLKTLVRPGIWKLMLPASLIGTYVALMFWLAGMKFTQASTASALNQTASLWTFLLAVVVLKEPVTRWRLIGLGGGMVGVGLVTFG